MRFRIRHFPLKMLATDAKTLKTEPDPNCFMTDESFGGSVWRLSLGMDGMVFSTRSRKILSPGISSLWVVPVYYKGRKDI